MATQLSKEISTGTRTIRDDGGGELLGGLLSKAVLFFDAEGRVLAVHCEVDRLRAWTDGLLEQPSRLVPAPLLEIVERSRSTGQVVRGRELPIPASTGVLESFQAAATPIRGPSGAIRGVTVAIYDLAPIQGSGQNLGQLVRLASIGTLAAGLAHEIKNALVAVNTFVDILVNKFKDSELAPIVAREIRRIDHIVGQMLRVSGPQRPSYQEVRVHELIAHALSVAQHRMAGSRILLEQDLSADPDVVSGDSSQLEQAFVNLLFNAVEAMGNHGTLTVKSALARLDDGAPVLRVTIGDTGTGIPQESLHRIFEPFFTTKATGHGLGLVITRKIIMDHGGTIRVQSQEGKGTSFTLEVPSAARRP